MSKTVLITGSSSGIGKATAEAFAEAGWNVAATSRTPGEKLFEKWPNIKTYYLDVTDNSSIEAAFTSTLKDFKTIDVVFSNAGYGLDGIFEVMSDEQIHAQFNTNVFGSMRVIRQAVKIMHPAKGGMIIQNTSMGGRLTFPLLTMYHSSKWALEGFCESLHYELGLNNIRLKIIEPGVIHTEFYGKGRKKVEAPSELGYDEFVEKVEKVSQGSGAKGKPPEVVAKIVLKAANSSSGKLRYAAGAPAPLLLTLRRLLPERVFFWIVRKSYRI